MSARSGFGRELAPAARPNSPGGAFPPAALLARPAARRTAPWACGRWQPPPRTSHRSATDSSRSLGRPTATLHGAAGHGAKALGFRHVCVASPLRWLPPAVRGRAAPAAGRRELGRRGTGLRRELGLRTTRARAAMGHGLRRNRLRRGRGLRRDAAASPYSSSRRSRFVSARRFFSASLRSRAAAVGVVGTRCGCTRSASRSSAARRARASSRFRARLRSSWATARSTGPARASTRRFWASLSAPDARTSNTATTRVSERCACWPPGPLEREKRSSTSSSGSTTERVTRIDSSGMAAILLDVDGVLHVSGQPLPGAADAVRRLRRDGHRLRFVTNATTRSKAKLAAELQAMGIELAADEVQTTADAAVAALQGRRVLALVMHAFVGDLEGVELVGENADAVLIGGADDSPETNLVFSYMNLARAFAELELGAELYCLHRNRWWQ